MGIRTFLALDLDERIREDIADARSHIGDHGAKIKWVAPENQHVTLKFLGDVADDMIDQVRDLTSSIAADVNPFDFEVRGVISVPPKGRLRMLWIGIEDGTGKMAELHIKLDSALAGMGFPRENRAFKPHATLARVRFAPNPDALRQAADKFADQDFGTQQTDHVTIYSSQLTPQGPIYTPLTHAKLGD